MLAVKTAISIQKPLFKEAEIIAQSMNISRSRLFVIALQDYIDRKKNRELLAQINSAYSDEPDDSELTLRTKSARLHKRIVGNEW